MKLPTRHRIPTVALAGLLWAGLLVPPVQAEENRWGFGSDLGFTSGTVNGTVFTLGFNLDYYVDRNFSFGPMMQINPTGDLFQISFAGVAKYHIRFNNKINLVPLPALD
jgi:hypothetical protein